MAKKTKSAISGNRSWTILQQEGRKEMHAPSFLSYFRRMGTGMMGFLLVLIVGGIVLTALYLSKEGRGPLARQVEPKRPVRKVILNTDGVLRQEWLLKTLNIEGSMDLREVNIRALMDQVLQVGQVRGVRVRREYPDQLVFDVQEHHPFAKIIASERDGSRILLLVSDEGHVYRGINYTLRILEELPFLNGVELQRTDNGFRPVAGMERIVALWRTAMQKYPHLLRQWTRLDISGYNPARYPYLGVIRIQSKLIPEIVFAPRDYAAQLDALEFIQYQHRNRLPGAILRIDLTSPRSPAVLPAR